MMNQTKQTETRFAFTLVELLVVISIMAALTALMLPRLRTINQDRGIREAARVVGSKFAEASDRARRDGAASVTLLRNPNMVDVDGVVYGASSMYLSRAVPNFIGDTGASATVVSVSPYVLQIPEPLEFDAATPTENVVRVGDSIRVGSAASPVSSPVAYEIAGFSITPAPPAGTLHLILNVKSTQPDPPSGGPVSYVIERQPKILRSSITDLPPGYVVDLRLSGPLEVMETLGNSGITDGAGVPINTRPLFYEKLRFPADPNTTDPNLRGLQNAYQRIDVLFDSTGGMSSVRTYRGNWDGTDPDTGLPDPDGEPVSQVLTGPMELFITPTELEAESSPIYSDSNLWVTVSNTSGGVNIGYNNPPLAAAGPTLGDLVTEARRTASAGQSASQ